MARTSVASILLLGFVAFSNADALDITLRLGQGGLVDERPPDRKLGGGQLALDVKLGDLPVAVSLAQEYYKKSPDATQPYEIQGMVIAYLLYVRTLLEKRATGHLGGGIGLLQVPQSGYRTPGDMETGAVFELVGGTNVRVFWKMGLYVEGRYLYASKRREETEVIDFGDWGALVGISLNLAW